MKHVVWLLAAALLVAVAKADHHLHASQLPAQRPEPRQYAAPAGADQDDDEASCAKEEEFSAIDSRLDKLTARMQAIRQRVFERTDPELVRKARSLRVRVENMQEKSCGDRHFQCGGDDPECHSYLFICDGKKDCRNGADEENCEVPVKQGDYFEGHVLWDTCTSRKPDTLGFEILGVRTASFFTPVTMLHANIMLEFDRKRIEGRVSLPTVGAYSQGRRLIAFKPPEDDRLAMYCQFDGFETDKCKGAIAHEGSGNICAEIIFVRKTA